MLYTMLLAHLLGDYVLQWDTLARWKARSLMGVITHGGIVTLTTLMCAVSVAPTWWPYALLIGITHTLIDVVRARCLHPRNTTWELMWYVLDQVAHVAIIVLTVKSSPTLPLPEPAGVARLLSNHRLLAFTLGYLLLVNPAWVLLRFVVRGVWGMDAAPCLSEGDKYGPMVERVVIATCVLLGQFYLVPLVLLPRRLRPIRVQGQGVGVLLHPAEHWAETALGACLAIGVGLAVRFTGLES